MGVLETPESKFSSCVLTFVKTLRDTDGEEFTFQALDWLRREGRRAELLTSVVALALIWFQRGLEELKLRSIRP